MKNKIIVVGVGPGEPSFLTLKAEAAIKNSVCAVVSERHFPLAEGCKKIIELKNLKETMKKIEAELENGDVSVLVSGDPGIYSLLPYIKKNFPKSRVEVIPGISSLQTLASEVCETWNESVILSGHGREIKDSEVLNTADKNRSTLFFCGGEKNPSWLAALLAENGLDDTELIIGENLSYDDQRITRGRPSELARGAYDPLSLAMIVNETPSPTRTTRPRDSEFIRSEVPMTREEVRSVIIDKLEIERDSVVWDIGAGTGSVTVAAALEASRGEVCAVECESPAAELVRANVKKFRLFNTSVHNGRALEVIAALPRPTHVFIGGSGDELEELLQAVRTLGSGIKVVVSCVTLKTYTKAFMILNGAGYANFDAVQISVSRAKKLGTSIIMAAQNPITIMSALTDSEKKEVL